MMKKGVAALFVVVLMAALAHETAAADPPPPPVCDPMALQSCSGAILFSLPPSKQCCDGLKAQQPCFCQYLNDPQYATFIASPNAKRVAEMCGVTIPTNC